MSEVNVQYGDSASDTAVLLLAAAEKLDLDPGVVRTVEGGFVVPKEVADEADVDYESDDDEDQSGDDSSVTDEEKPAAKKTAAKKTAAAKK